jgi:hypothetical protein
MGRCEVVAVAVGGHGNLIHAVILVQSIWVWCFDTMGCTYAAFGRLDTIETVVGIRMELLGYQQYTYHFNRYLRRVGGCAEYASLVLL